MPYVFITVQNGGWDATLPINMDYSPDLDPEIHGFLRDQQHNRGPTQEGRGSAATHCELRLILDGLEKLGFQLVTTASYTFQGRPHNEFIMHRDSIPSDPSFPDSKRQHPVVVSNSRSKQHSSQPQATSYGNERREHSNGNERREHSSSKNRHSDSSYPKTTYQYY